LTGMQTIALAAALCFRSAFAQPVEAKLNDFAFSVSDLLSAKRLYSNLGFLMSEGGRSSTNGKIDNSMSAFRDGGGLALFQRPEGAPFRADADLEVASVERASRDLNDTGLKMKAPTTRFEDLDPRGRN
jgi:hypothetical protein